MMLIAGAVPAGADTGRWRSEIDAAAARFAIPAAWIEQVMAIESGGRTELRGRPTVSRSGAMGLMQLMPATWSDMRLAYGLGPDPFDPHDNIIAGTAYLRALYDRFGYPGLFAAYNAGPARLAKHLGGGRPLPLETIDYVARLTSPTAPTRRSKAVGASLPPFGIGVHSGPARADGFDAAMPSDVLFAIRR